MKFLSLFSGIGGFELGMEQSIHNFECVGFSEIDKYAESIYIRQFPNHKRLGDIKEVELEELPNFELLVGGFPCQSFSNSGTKRGFDDTRGTLFFEIARILADKRPPYFLLENVQGLLHNNKGETFKRILGILTDLGYCVEWKIFNTKDFGLPHNRERVFIKGYLGRECGGRILHNRLPYGQSVSRLEPLKHDDNEPFLKIRESTKKGFKEAYPFDGVLLNRANRKIAKGIVRKEHCGCLQTGKIWGVVMPDLRIRYLTPLECERLQGFPDNYTKYNSDGELLSDTKRYKYIGNAVSVNVIKYIFDYWMF